MTANKPARDLLGWAALAAALAVTMSAEYALARACGFGPYVAAGVPAALDIYAVRALRAHRDVPVVVGAMIAVNALSHLVAAGILTVSWPLVVAVSSIAPLVLWRVHRLADAPAEQANTPQEAPVFAPVFVEQSEVFAPVETTPAVEAPALVNEANTPVPADKETEQEAPGRLSTEEARQVVEQCWANGLGVRETARQATRSPSTVTAAFARLEKAKGPQPVAGQLALVQ